MTRPLLALAALALAACAAAPPPAASPEPPPPGMFGQPRERSPADDEMLALGKAEEEIDRLVARRDAPGRSKVTPSPGDAPEPEKPSAPAPMAEGPGDRCAVACRALASMASSADRLCRLAGETDGRCDDARSRVRGATARVGAACPHCAAR